MSDTTNSLYSTLLSSLLPPRGTAQVLAHDDARAVLEYPDAPRMVLVARHDEALGAWLERVGGSLPEANVQVVVVGGDASVQSALKAVQRADMGGRLFEVFHIDDARKVWFGPYASEMSDVGVALKALESGTAPAPLAAEFLRSQLAQGARVHQAAAEEHGAYLAQMRARLPVVTIGLIVLNVLMYGLEHVFGGANNLVLAHMGANFHSDTRAGALHLLLTSTLLHAGNQHLLFNMLALGSLGYFLEKLLGPWRFVTLYVLSGIGGSAVAARFSSADLSVGASGCIWGLLAALGGIAARPRGLMPPSVISRMRSSAVQGLAFNLLASFAPGVAMSAHLGGGLVGGLLGLSGLLTLGMPSLEARRTQGDATRESAGSARGYRLAAAVSVGMLVASVGVGFAKGRPWELSRAYTWTRRTVGATGISIELPEMYRETASTSQTEPAVVDEKVYGDVKRDGVVLSVRVLRLAQRVEDVVVRRSLLEGAKSGDLTAMIPKMPPGASTQMGEVTDKEGNPTLELDTTFANGNVMRTWLQLRAGYRIEVQAAKQKDIARDVLGEMRRAVGSIREAGGT